MTSRIAPLPLDEDIETVFSHVLAEINPKEIGRGKMVFVIFQNPFLNPDGTTNNSNVFVGSASNMIYLMIPGQESPPIYAEDLKDIYIRLNFPAETPNGGILTAGIGTGGIGYHVGSVLNVLGGATIATITVLTIDGHITAAPVAAGGALYTAGDVLSVTGGNGLGRIVVDTVDGGGAVLTSHVSVAGGGYANGVAATTGGTGAGATFTLTVTGVIVTFGVTTPGTGYTVGGVYPTSGGGGAGATIEVLTTDDPTATSADVSVFIYRRRLGGKQ